MTVTAGLVTQDDKAVPLVGVKVHAVLVDFTVNVTIEQHFYNNEEFPIEAEYLVGVNVFASYFYR